MRVLSHHSYRLLVVGFLILSGLSDRFLVFSQEENNITDIDNNSNDTDFYTNTNTNSCFETTLEAGCSDPICRSYICENVDSFCCNRKWDEKCVEAAADQYAGACKNDWPEQTNDCFMIDKFGRPGCNDTNSDTCELLICDLRPECCTDSDDENCVALSLKKCDVPTPTNLCIVESYLPGCANDDNGMFL